MFIRDFWGFLGGGANVPSAPSESASAGGYTIYLQYYRTLIHRHQKFYQAPSSEIPGSATVSSTFQGARSHV